MTNMDNGIKLDYQGNKSDGIALFKQDLSKIFHQYNLDIYANATDLGFQDINKGNAILSDDIQQQASNVNDDPIFHKTHLAKDYMSHHQLFLSGTSPKTYPNTPSNLHSSLANINVTPTNIHATPSTMAPSVNKSGPYNTTELIHKQMKYDGPSIYYSDSKAMNNNNNNNQINMVMSNNNNNMGNNDNPFFSGPNLDNNSYPIGQDIFDTYALYNDDPPLSQIWSLESSKAMNKNLNFPYNTTNNHHHQMANIANNNNPNNNNKFLMKKCPAYLTNEFGMNGEYDDDAPYFGNYMHDTNIHSNPNTNMHFHQGYISHLQQPQVNSNNNNNNNNNSINPASINNKTLYQQHLHQQYVVNSSIPGHNHNSNNIVLNNNSSNSHHLQNQPINPKLKIESIENDNNMNHNTNSLSISSNVISRKIEADISSNSKLAPIMDISPDELSKKINGSITKNKKRTPMSNESIIDDPNSDSKNRSSRGLRVLSLKVKEIVCEKKETSYKEVAESLIGEAGSKIRAKSQTDANSKDEQNVKRRVYDALNVLIAADILKKKGKIVYCDDTTVHSGMNKKKKIKEEKEHLDRLIHELKKKSKTKIEVLQELTYKCLAIKHLLKRNREKEELLAKQKVEYAKNIATNAKKSSNHKAKQDELKQEAATQSFLKTSNEEIIKFPFIVLLNNSSQYSMTMNMSPNKHQLSILSRNPLTIFGDIDILLKMKLHYVQRDFFEQNLPKDLIKYLPSTFFDENKLKKELVRQKEK